MNINHLNVREFFQNSVGCKSRGSSTCKISQSCVETISQKGNKNMSFNSLFQLVPDGTDGKLSLQILKCLLNAGQKQIKIPRRFQAKQPAYWSEADSVPHVATFAAGVHGPVRNGPCVHSPILADLGERYEPAQSLARLLSLMPLYASAGCHA